MSAQEPAVMKAVKVKLTLFRTRHEGPEGKYRHSSTPPLSSVLDGVSGRHGLAALPPGKTECSKPIKL